MNKIEIAGNGYPLKYTIESWKKLKEKGIDPNNIQVKMKEDFADCISTIVLYGLSIDDRAKVTTEQIDVNCGFDVIDVILPAIMESMPKSVRDKAQEQ